jgi:mono/diheme cytochrome c family protein
MPRRFIYARAVQSERGIRGLLIGLALFLTPFDAGAANEEALFTNQITPLLQARCVQCHQTQRSRGGLNLTTRELLLKGGENGPAILPGHAAKSLLMQMISGSEPQMPKQGSRLRPEEIAAFGRWIDAGAVWPKGLTLIAVKPAPRVGPDWWSLRKLTRPTVPEVKDKSWIHSPIDAFVLAKLEARGLRPSPAADRRTLIRRVTFDLHGLPPTPAAVEAFLNDASPNAYERLLDGLLDSPHYGERWGRHWLDVVHFGDTHGYDKDKRRDHAWPYRDYVIRSLNQDKPYTRFVKEQIAGDVLYPGSSDGIIGTGFIAAGPWDFVGHVELREGTVDKDKTRLLDRDDMVSNTISTFLSLTAHCARCHDHKFDPIPKREYYGLQAVFAGVDRGDRPYARTEFADNRTQKIAQSPTAGEQVYAILPHVPRPIYDLNRGDVEQRGDVMRPGVLSCVVGLEDHLKSADPNAEGVRRAALACWITDPKNVLTWRSIANRIWHYHFGRGIVDTPNDFGWNGSRPTHPELLDWLAAEFLEHGQSFKQLHRLILQSSTYRQASGSNSKYAAIDAENRFLWRMNRRRLEAEEIRDAVLAASGKLDFRMGGPGFELFQFKDDHSPIYDHSALDKINSPAAWRRTVYRFTVRSVPNPFLECLDCADPNLNTPVRTTTLTALQALALLNDPFITKQAEYFAERLSGTSLDLHQQVETAFQLALGRRPSSEERDELTSFASKHGLANVCRLLLNTNEFVFID